MKSFGICQTRVQFCADYGVKRAGFLWKAHSMDQELLEMSHWLHSNGISIKRIKLHGRIHSIWFDSYS